MDRDDELTEDAEPVAPPDAETASALERAFADVGGSLRPIRARVLERLPAPGRSGRQPPALRPIPFLGRKRRLFLLVNALAASLLVATYAAYLSVIRIQRQAQAAHARVEVRNLAIVIRTLRERAAAAAPATTPAAADVERAAFGDALARLGLESDPYGNPYALASAGRVYSYGPNGRDEGGAGDDFVGYAR